MPPTAEPATRGELVTADLAGPLAKLEAGLGARRPTMLGPAPPLPTAEPTSLPPSLQL